MNSLNNPEQGPSHNPAASTERQLVDESLAWDMAHAAQPFHEAARVLKQAGVDNEAARLVSKADVSIDRIEREHYKKLGLTKATAELPLLQKPLRRPNNTNVDGPIPEHLLAYPIESYVRRNWDTGGIVHNPELAEELAYTQAPYEDARKELLNAGKKPYEEWTAEEKSDEKKKRTLRENARIAIKNSELEYYDRQGTSLKAVAIATKALFLDKLWALDEQRKAALDPDTAEAIEQKINELSDYARLAGSEYRTKRFADEKRQRQDARKTYNQEILANKEDFLKQAADALLVPAAKKGELPTLNLPIGVTNRIWQKFMEYHNESPFLASDKEQDAVAERLGIYWNEIGYKYVTKEELGGHTTPDNKNNDEDKLHHKSIRSVVIDKPGYISTMGLKGFETYRSDLNPKMRQSSQNAKLGAAKLLTIINEVLAEPRNEAEDNFDPQTDPNLRRYRK